MKENEKKVKAAEEAKEEAKPEENDVKLTDEKLSSVSAGTGVRYNVLGEITK